MEDKKGNPSEGLTREQVMAQRAEKKKLKEARKNKSGAAGGAVSDAKPDPKPKKPQQPHQQQPKEAISKAKDGDHQKLKDETMKANTSTKGSKPKHDHPPALTRPVASPKKKVPANQENKAPADVVSPAKKAEPEVPLPKGAAPLTKASSGASVAEAGKTTEKHGSKASECQSTIHSLFRGPKIEPLEDKGFQPHALFYNLGVKFKNEVIRGANSRCIKLLTTMRDFVQGYKTNTTFGYSGFTFKHGVLADLNRNLDALRRICPFGIGMSNATEYIISHIYKVHDGNKDINRLKEEIMLIIDQYIEEKIEKAVEAIYVHGKDSIQDGDVIMIYSITEALLNLLETVATKGKISFELILILTPDTMPDIRVLLEKLKGPVKNLSVTISSVNFSNAIYKMRHSTKLIVGGHGLFTTGGVMAQSGSGKLALLASTYNKPAIFLCETFKFCDRSPLDFFTLDEFMSEKCTSDNEIFEPKIKYDVTPANLVTVVITDIDLLPSTSVPVVLRVQEGRSPRKDDDES